ncbi:MAG: sulfurtransferase complex subunit TusB [Pseudohongiellaceae bacterium]|nr:sulfurtransferase complex subunit TusB [Pseudohongiellaceae bacterium]
MSSSKLHTVNKPALNNDSLVSCLQVSTDQDCVLLIEDGVYSAPMITAAMAKDASALTDQEAELKALIGQREIRLCALEDDVKARGLDPAALSRDIDMVSYAEFVQLVLQYPKTISWF